ncbi:uncharacterized protein LOC144743210 [Ciona intestinalis]
MNFSHEMLDLNEGSGNVNKSNRVNNGCKHSFHQTKKVHFTPPLTPQSDVQERVVHKSGRTAVFVTSFLAILLSLLGIGGGMKLYQMITDVTFRTQSLEYDILGVSKDVQSLPSLTLDDKQVKTMAKKHGGLLLDLLKIQIISVVNETTLSLGQLLCMHKGKRFYLRVCMVSERKSL